MEKLFKLGLVLGRFNHIHSGHIQLIELSRNICDKTLVLIGSAQESGTLRNPFSFETRKKLFDKIYTSDDIIVMPLNDMTNENDISFDWGKYIISSVEKMYGQKPDLMIYGKDNSRKGWFSPEDSKTFSELIISRNKIDISATKLREYLMNNNFEEWKKYVPSEIIDMYNKLRNELLKIEDYKKNNA